MAEIIPHDEPWLHVRFEGRSWDIPCSTLDVGELSSDDQIRAALAAHFDVAVGKFRLYVIERHDNKNITVRPEAVFG